MIRFILVLSIFACIATSCGSNPTAQFDNAARSASVTNATTAWNLVCTQYHFIPKPLDPTVTFSQGYYGRDFATENGLITSRVNDIVGAQNIQAPTQGNDVMKARIENWGLVGGGL